MTIQRLPDDVAQGATNALRFAEQIEEVAVHLFRWQHDLYGALIPTSFPVPELPGVSRDISRGGATYYRRQARAIRDIINGADTAGKTNAKLGRPSYLIGGGHVWYLARRNGATQAGSEAAVRASAASYIRLVLQNELFTQSTFPIADTDPVGGFGPGVYLLHKVSNNGRRLQLAEVRFDVTPKHRLLLCNARASPFYRRDAVSPLRVGTVDVGQGFMTDIIDAETSGVARLDGREYPIPGIQLRRTEFRSTRLYYLNILTEFAMDVFRRAGVRFVRDVFTATHCVQDGYLPLKPVAQLARPLVVVNATEEPVRRATLLPLYDLQRYFARGFHVAATDPVRFEQPEVDVAATAPAHLLRTVNYLFLNGAKVDGLTARIIHARDSQSVTVPLAHAYNCLESESGTADMYTKAKYTHLMDRDSFAVIMQGLDVSPSELATLSPDTINRVDLHEKLKRCLVELSLKEIVLGCKPFPVSGLPQELRMRALTIVGTRSLKIPPAGIKQMIALVDVEIDKQGIWVRDTRRTPWSNERTANLSFVEALPFLLDEKQRIRDKQLWVIDRMSGKRLCVWYGSFIPKIILNNRYAGIEAALAAQDEATADARSSHARSFYSKSKLFNFLPYYISMLPAHLKANAEQMGRLIPIQDCGSWVRVFVPPADGIVGTGASLSCMRDVMLYDADGTLLTHDLLGEPLMQIYLHTMTNGILVGGGNSKMSVLEKFVRVVLEN